MCGDESYMLIATGGALEVLIDAADELDRLADELAATESTAAEYRRTIENDTLERAAKCADELTYGPCGEYDLGYTNAKERADDRARDIARDIRSLKG